MTRTGPSDDDWKSDSVDTDSQLTKIRPGYDVLIFKLRLLEIRSYHLIKNLRPGHIQHNSMVPRQTKTFPASPSI